MKQISAVCIAVAALQTMTILMAGILLGIDYSKVAEKVVDSPNLAIAHLSPTRVRV